MCVCVSLVVFAFVLALLNKKSCIPFVFQLVNNCAYLPHTHIRRCSTPLLCMCVSDFDISWRLRHAIQETKILQLKSSMFAKVIVFAHTHILRARSC